MNLPSFLWLWRIAAWSMGLSLSTYVILALSGLWLRSRRVSNQPRPAWLRPVHLGLGLILVSLVLLLLTIGIVGTLGEYGSLGHSLHLVAGLGVVGLVGAAAFTGLTKTQTLEGKRLHVQINGVLFFALMTVLGSGWIVVQKYLP